MGHQLACTLFYSCGGGSASLIPFNTLECVADDNGTRDEADHNLDDNDEVDNK